MKNKNHKNESRVTSSHNRKALSASFSKDGTFYKDDTALRELIGKTYKNRYKIQSLIDSDEISVSFKAVDLDNSTAVMLRAPRYFQPEIIKSFTLESSKLAALQKIDTKNTIKLLDSFLPFIVEEYQNKTNSLASKMEESKHFTELESLKIIHALASSLVKAHKLSLLHGRVNPKFVYVMEENEKTTVKLGGYGLSSSQVMLAKHKLISKNSPYLCTSIFHNHKAEVQDDIYSVAVLGYRILSGRLPVIASLQSISSTQFESLSKSCQAILDKEKLNSTFKRALKVADQKPYPSMDEFLEDIQQLLESIEKQTTVEHKIKGSNNEPITEGQNKELTTVAKSNAAETIDPNENDEILDKLQSLIDTRKEHLANQKKVDKASISPSLENTAKRLEFPQQDKKEPLPQKEKVAPVSDLKASDSKIGSIVLDRYVLLEILGTGSATIVYLAKDMQEDRMVAVKTLLDPQPDLVLAFAREVEQISKLEHENLVQFIDYQESEGSPYYIMEHVDAPTMQSLLNQISSIETEEQIAGAAIQICDVLDYLHENNINHGNISAESVMFLEQDGEVLIKVCGLGTIRVKELASQNGVDQNALALFDQIPHTKSDTSKLDIVSATELIYQMTTGRMPYELARTDNLTESSKDLESIKLFRPDMFGVEKLDKVLKKVLGQNQENLFNSIKDLKEGIKGWIDSAYEDLDLSVPDNSGNTSIDKTEWLNNKEAKSLEELKEEMRKNMHLKSNQVKTEGSLAIKFTTSANLSGRRKSPARTTLEIFLTVVLGGLGIYFASDYCLEHQTEIKTKYFNLARNFSQAVSGRRPLEKGVDLSTDEIAFDYKEDLAYKRWTIAKHVGETRRIMPDGTLQTKK